MIGLAFPLALILLPLPLLIRALPGVRAGEALRLPARIAAAAVPADTPLRRRIWPALAWGALVLALAGPERLVPMRDVSASGRDIILALDMSGSMLTEDFTLDGQRVTRLDAVKRTAQAFVAQRVGDRIGLVLFADRAYVAAPPSHDLAAVARAIGEASVGITGRSTAIAEGLGLALRRLDASDARSRVIVLLSDGRDSDARVDARQVAALAASHGVRVHTIALGPDGADRRDGVDAAALSGIAETSGGQSWRVRQSADLTAMSADLDRLEPNPSTRPPVIVARPLWPWPAAAALLAALASAFRGAV